MFSDYIGCRVFVTLLFFHISLNQKLYHYMLFDVENQKLDGIELVKPLITRMVKSLCYSLTIDAPLDFVWDIRANPEYLPLYFRTETLTNKSFTGDIKVGGKAKLVLEDEDGNEHITFIRFVEINPYDSFKEELESSLNPGNKFLVREYFKGFSNRTKYQLSLMFNENEDLYKLMESGWHLAYQEIMFRFEDLMADMLKKRDSLTDKLIP